MPINIYYTLAMSKKRLPVSDVSPIQTTSQVIRTITDGSVITTSIQATIEVHSKVVDYGDILEACEVVPDDDMSAAPWDDCDGYRHHLESVDDAMPGDTSLVDEGGRYGRHQRVVLDDCGLPNAAYFHARGASRQVAFELAAEAKRKCIAQLVKWHNEGWSWYGVTCDVNGEHDSLWGIDDDDYAYNEVRYDVANNVAYQLEKAGYVVKNKAARWDKANAKLEELKRNLSRFTVSGR